MDALKGISHRFDIGLLHAVVGRSDSSKTALLLLDQSFTETASALRRYITFSRILFPALFLMVGLMGFLISRLMVKRMEFAVMWGLFASQKQRGASFFLEQALLCLTGCLIGRALSVQAVGRTNLMALLSERE